MKDEITRFSAADVSLLAEAAAWPNKDDFATLDAVRLNEIARSRGLEFATAVAYNRALRVPANAEFFSRVSSARAASAEFPNLIALVPGAFYREHTGTGADGARILRIAEELGCPAEVVPIASFGTVETNARTIVEWLLKRSERRIALVSLSKGGSEVKHALSNKRSKEAFACVQLWVSFSGIVEGTPLIAWLRARPLRWWGVHLVLWSRRQRGRALADLDRGSNTLLEKWPVVPNELRLIHICGFPLRRHLRHPWAYRAYERLAPLGPNDGGGILLGDMSRVPGIVFPVWGADHYLQPAWGGTSLFRDIVIAALTPPLCRHPNQSAKTAMIPPAGRSTA